MKIYITGYVQRWKGIALTIVGLIVTMVLSGILFYGKLNKLCCQLDGYACADYSVIYVLNYSAKLPNECIFPNTDIQLFTDKTKRNRMTAVSVMRENEIAYGLEYLKQLNAILPSEILISQNIADRYGIQIGSKVYAEVPYTTSLMVLNVSGIISVDYDYICPNVDNDIGIVYLGYIEDYDKSVQCKYIEFASDSESETLSEYPQIIYSIINKSDNISYVLKQGLAILIFQMVFCVMSVLVGHVAFFSKSKPLLRRCYLKGMKLKQMVSIPLLEKIMFGLVPGIITSRALFAVLPGRSLLRLTYSLLPSVVWVGYCMIMLCVDMVKIRKRETD